MALTFAQRQTNIESRCRTLAEIIKAVHPIYATASPYDQSLIETMIGAAIWYIPKPANSWSGMISLETIKSFHPDSPSHTKPKISEEHIFPRKLAGRQLLRNAGLNSDSSTNVTNMSNFKTLFEEKYCKVHYVTPLENKHLVSFQKSDSFFAPNFNPENIYTQANIQLIKVSKEELAKIKKRDREMIEAILKNPQRQ